VTYAALYQSAFHIVGIESRLRKLLPVASTSLFVSVAAPVANMGRSASWVGDVPQRGQSGRRAAARVVPATLADVGTILVEGNKASIQEGLG
jgi:hypothetical protein